MKVCIDPGHGFSNRRPGVYDPGAEAFGLSEADIVLQWALSLKWVFGQKGIDCWLTRDDDKDPDPVSSRDDRAEQAGCTHFIALHCNAADGSASGVETYYRDSADKTLAAAMQSAALKATKGRDRGLKTEQDSQHTRLAVFDFDGPACLVELEFIDGANRGSLTSRDSRLIFANAVADYFLGIAK